MTVYRQPQLFISQSCLCLRTKDPDIDHRQPIKFRLPPNQISIGQFLTV